MTAIPEGAEQGHCQVYLTIVLFSFLHPVRAHVLCQSLAARGHANYTGLWHVWKMGVGREGGKVAVESRSHVPALGPVTQVTCSCFTGDARTGVQLAWFGLGAVHFACVIGASGSSSVSSLS